MKEIVFNSEQKEILLEFLKRRFEIKPIYHQMYKALKDANKHFFTPVWSEHCAYAISDGYHIFKDEYDPWEDYEFQIMLGRLATKPKTSKKFEFWRDLNKRIRIPWDENATYQIVFQ